MKRHPFTLIEMLVVISIIGILAGLLSGPVMNSMGKGKIAVCTNNLKMCGNLVEMYKSDNDGAFPDWLSETQYGGDKGLFLCPLDEDHGKQGSRPDWIKDNQYSETNDMPTECLSAVDKAENRRNYSTCGREPQAHFTDDNLKIKAFSYMYEFCKAPCSWLSNPSSYGLNASNATWQNAKKYEMRMRSTSVEGSDGQTRDGVNLAAFVPVIRCYYHNDPTDATLDANGKRDLATGVDHILNYRVSGAVSSSPPNYWWEEIR